MKKEELISYCPECGEKVICNLGQITKLEHSKGHIFSAVCKSCDAWLEGNKEEILK